MHQVAASPAAKQHRDSAPRAREVDGVLPCVQAVAATGPTGGVNPQRGNSSRDVRDRERNWALTHTISK